MKLVVLLFNLWSCLVGIDLICNVYISRLECDANYITGHD